ncbi:MAG TPA: protein translocase subunit SecF [Acidimicrobiia bacterium]|nr:protein translocase subunit SecF [Acidimicrobiia bacterium]
MSLKTQLQDIFHERTNYDFIGPTKRWFAISGLLIVIGMAGLGIHGGLNLGIDFKGGTAWEVKAGSGHHISSGGARDVATAAGVVEPSVQILGGDTIRLEAGKSTLDEQTKVREALAKYAGAEPGDVSINDVGPTWGGEVSHKAIRALVFFFIAIAVYLSLRFEWKMAIAAILAVVHDILITVGAYAVTRFDVTPATVIAFLTILGFSLYDTVVVFDKVEENVAGIGATGRETYSGVVNRSMNEVLMRSLNTSFVAVLPVFSLLFVGAYLFGAVTLKDFSLALFIGLMTGAYSSIFVATPILALLKEREPRYAAIRQKLAGRASVVAERHYAGAGAGGGGGRSSASRASGGGRSSTSRGGGGSATRTAEPPDDDEVEEEKPEKPAATPRTPPRPVPTRRPAGAAPRPRQKRRKR